MNNLNQLLKETTQIALKNYDIQQKQLIKEMEETALFFIEEYLSKWLLEVAQQGKEYMGFILFIDEDEDKNRISAIEFDPDTTPTSKQSDHWVILTYENLYFTPEILYNALLKQSFDEVIFNPKKYKFTKNAPLWCYNFGISWSTDKKISFFSEKKENKTSIERNKMTPGLRFDVLKRDNYKCQICGRTQKDGVKLHIDHIIPIAKGGKTELNNLQTLCQDCNLGKGVKLM